MSKPLPREQGQPFSRCCMGNSQQGIKEFLPIARNDLWIKSLSLQADHSTSWCFDFNLIGPESGNQ